MPDINPNGYMVRLIDGPYGGREVRLKAGIEDPADTIITCELEMTAPGHIAVFDYGKHPLLERDCIYQIRNRSQLPADIDNKHLVRGAEYTFVRQHV